MIEYKGKRVFVSGAAGVIGREMIPILVESGAIVMAADLDPIPENFPKNIIFNRIDLNYLTQEEIDKFNPEIFIHLAASFERSVESYDHWNSNFWNNIRLSNHLMSLMRNVKDLKKVVFPSSYLIFDKQRYNFKNFQDSPINLKESDPISPRNLTGMAKLAHEIELDFLKNFKGNQFTSVCARIYRGYGKNSRDVISRWVRDLLSGKKISVYNPEGIFDFIYAEDTAKGLLKLGISDYEGVINLGTGRSRKISDIIRVLSNHFPNIEIENNKTEIPYEASQADVSKLHKVLGWLPERDFENSIPDIIEFEKNRNSSKDLILNLNILITSISKKVPMINAVKNAVQKISKEAKVFGADLDDSCIGKYFVDNFWKIPAINELSINDLINYCNSNNIIAIIPTRDGELEYFSKHRSELCKSGITVMVSDYPTVEICLDKFKFSNYKDKEYFIPSFLNIEELNSNKFVVKERYGSGSLSIGVNLDAKEAKLHARSLKNPIFQPFINGYEITVDAYVSRKKQVKGLVMRKRIKVVNGESQVTETFENTIFRNMFMDLINKFDFYGHITFQAIIDNSEKVHLIECNPRIGGASNLSIYFGLDTFFWFYLEALGKDISAYPFLTPTRSITQIRHLSDTYF